MQAKRRALFEKGGPPANRPGTSAHEAGMAFDVASVTLSQSVVKIFKKHGFNRTAMPKEPWHFAWKGYSRNKIKEAQRYYRECIKNKSASTFGKGF